MPPYSLGLNPDEYLNHALKLDVHSGNHPRTKEDLKHKVHSFMRSLQHRQDSVEEFFGHENLQYIRATV